MKIVLLAFSIIVLPSLTLADWYLQTNNAAISGCNKEQLKNVTPQNCMTQCTGHNWCKSFDYHKGKNKCDLSECSIRDTKLKRDYEGNPFDHYSKTYKVVTNAAISGCNNKQLENVSRTDCVKQCGQNSWCKSFDYHKGKNKCDLSECSIRDTKLKRDYEGNPFDHFSKY